METIVTVGDSYKPRPITNWLGERRRMVIASFVAQFGQRRQMHYLESKHYSDKEEPKTIPEMAKLIYDNIPPEHRDMLSFSVSTPFTIENIEKLCVLQETNDFLIKDTSGNWYINR